MVRETALGRAAQGWRRVSLRKNYKHLRGVSHFSSCLLSLLERTSARDRSSAKGEEGRCCVVSLISFGKYVTCTGGTGKFLNANNYPRCRNVGKLAIVQL